MHPVPSLSASRGEVVLQPSYFTSSIYVKAFRDDLATLILKYHKAYSQTPFSHPFALFKTVWTSMGWHWLHFKIFESRSRQAFLEVTARLFLERTVITEAPFTRVVCLFAVYTFFYTQVEKPIPPLQRLWNLSIACDHYESLLNTPDTLTPQPFMALRPCVEYVLSRFQKDQIFMITPKSNLNPINPRDLPREIYAEGGIVLSNTMPKKKGRPAKKDKVKNARLRMLDLEELVSDSDVNSSLEAIGCALTNYQSTKLALLERGVSLESLKELSRAKLDELQEA